MSLADRFTEYLSAWSTLGGAVGSVLAVIVAGLLLRHELRSRNEERRDAEAGQARLVTVEVGAASGINGKILKMPFVLANRSAEPISEVSLTVRLSSEAEPFKVQLVSLDPQTQRRYEWKLLTPIAFTRHEYYVQYFATVVTFTDSKGLRWERCNWDQPTRWLPYRRPSLRQRLRWWHNRRRQSVARLARDRWAAIRACLRQQES